eukprot:COSAG05_NODE_9135_length_644_cov_10.598165_1_plen_186_part_00
MQRMDASQARMHGSQVVRTRLISIVNYIYLLVSQYFQLSFLIHIPVINTQYYNDIIDSWQRNRQRNRQKAKMSRFGPDPNSLSRTTTPNTPRLVTKPPKPPPTHYNNARSCLSPHGCAQPPLVRLLPRCAFFSSSSSFLGRCHFPDSQPLVALPAYRPIRHPDGQRLLGVVLPRARHPAGRPDAV